MEWEMSKGFRSREISSIAIVKYLIERKQPAFDVIVQKIRQEGEEFHRMVLGGKTNMAAWASSFSEVRISG